MSVLAMPPRRQLAEVQSEAESDSHVQNASSTTNVAERDGAKVPWFANNMAPNFREILSRLRNRVGGSKLKRRQVLDNAAWTHFPKLKILLLVVGYVWMLCLPLKDLSRGIYMDENALQPGGVRIVSSLSMIVSYLCIHQVNTYWNWGDVHRADTYLGELEKLRDGNASSAE